MKKQISRIAIAFTILLFGYCQADGQEIVYSDSLNFTAHLFQRGLPVNLNCAAEISTTIRLNVVEMYRDSMIIEVIAVMDTQHSWISTEYRDSVDVLEHEKYHFILSEFYARKLRLYLSKLDRVSYSNYQQIIYSQYRTLKKELRQMQSVYDHETNFGRDKVGQNKWITRLDASLLDLYDFSKRQVTLEVDN